MDLVTVYIPTKNRLKLLKRAIQSVKRQTYINIELIVVDDGSTDGTPYYLASEMAAGFLTAIFHHKSLGACVARNEAIIQAKGRFITGLDDDDYFISHQRIEFFVTKWNSMNKNIAGLFDSFIVATQCGELVDYKAQTVTFKSLINHNTPGNQIFAPKSHFLSAGLFDPLMPAWQDWDLWLRISEKFGTFENINRLSYLVDAAHDAERISTRDGGIIRSAMTRLREKMVHLTLHEKSSLIITMCAYPQVKPRIVDLLTLLMALRIYSFFKFTKKFLLKEKI